MTALFSASWYRVASLKPRLRGQARVARHHYRGQRWFVLQDLATGRFLRLNPEAYRIVALMDGERTLEQIWEGACVSLGDDAPTQDEILQLLTQLHQANVLLTGDAPDLDELDTRRRKLGWAKVKQYLTNPLSLKFPLIDPDRFLGWVVGGIPAWSRRWLLLAWFALVLSGLAGAVYHWSELTADITSRVFTPENMLLLALSFPVLKAIHEFGHGLAIKLFGGSCHEMGLMFLVAVPVPYVDASQSTAFVSKYQRMIVGAAGMMIELAAASVALWLWTMASPGVGKAFLHQIVIVAGFTTLVFNANPLLRFDGYYVLADWLEIPNLGQKANTYVGYLINRYLFGVRDGVPEPVLTPREAPWLVGYAVGSFVYRMTVAVAIVLFVAQQFFFIGVVLAAWSAWGTVGAPLWRHLRYLTTHRALAGHRTRAWSVAGVSVGLLVLLLGYVPVGSWTNAEGVVWMPEQSRVRAAHACFGGQLLAEAGSEVKAGQPLLSCADPELETLIAQYEARQSEMQARLAQAQATDRVQTQLVQSELTHSQQRLADVRERLAQLSLRAPHDGRFAMPSPGDFPGRFFNRGDVVGYVLDPSRFTLLTVVGQGDVDMVRSGTTRVELRMADQVAEMVPARIEREVPAATNQLPSMALALQGGGKIGLNPGASGKEPMSLASLFQFELKLDHGDALRKAGQRVYVQFVHPREPLASQWYRSVRQLFLKTFAA